MKTAKELRQDIEAKATEFDAIMAVAKEEDRELTPEENAAITAFYGTDDAPGELGKLEAQAATAKRIEAKRKELAATRMAPMIDDAPGGFGEPKMTIPAKAKRHGSLKAFKNAEDAYASGQFLRALVCKDEERAEAREWCGNHGVDIRAVMTEGVNTAGGFLVPEPMEMAIIVLQEQFGVFRQKALVYPMSSDTDRAPKLTGGLTVYFPAEAAAITASDVTLAGESLQATPMATLTRISKQLSEDAIVAIADLLAQQIARAFANTEDEQGFNGTGTAATYGGAVGIITAMGSASKATAATGNTAFSTLDDVDFLDMIGLLPSYPGIMPEWYIHKAGWAASMARLAAAGGGNTVQSLEGELRPMFHGYPVNFVNVMNSTLTAQTSTDGLCYFGDLSQGAILGTRNGVSIDADASVYFATNEIAIRGWQRTAVNIHDAGDGTNAGAIVGLTTPSS